VAGLKKHTPASMLVVARLTPLSCHGRDAWQDGGVVGDVLCHAWLGPSFQQEPSLGSASAWQGIPLGGRPVNVFAFCRLR
jgi:hypothetical protein